MKTQTKIIVPVVIIGSVLSFLIFKTDDTKNIEVTTSKNQVQVLENNTPSKVENISETKSTDLLSESETTQNIAKTSTGEISEENSEPKEISVVAEDILYPEEYDFSYFDNNPVMTAIGHPIKLDTSSFSTLEKGDIFEITFGGETYKFLIDNCNNNWDIYDFDSYNKEYSNSTLSIIHSINTELNTSLTGIDIYPDGAIDMRIKLKNGLGYYYSVFDYQKEFNKQGYKID